MTYRTHRYPTIFPVEISCDAKTQTGHLINITTTGAGVFDVTGLLRGDKVQLRCSVGLISGTVCWTDDDQCGVVFDQRLGTRQFEQLRHAPTIGRTVAHRQINTFTELR